MTRVRYFSFLERFAKEKNYYSYDLTHTNYCTKGMSAEDDDK